MAKSEGVKLLNKGERTIVYGLDHEKDTLKPGAGKVFPADIAEQLVRLFPSEIMNPDSAFAQFEKVSEVVEETELENFAEMTFAELKEAFAARPELTRPEEAKNNKEGRAALADILVEYETNKAA